MPDTQGWCCLASVAAGPAAAAVMRSVNPTGDLEEVYMGDDRAFLLQQANNFMSQVGGSSGPCAAPGGTRPADRVTRACLSCLLACVLVVCLVSISGLFGACAGADRGRRPDRPGGARAISGLPGVRRGPERRAEHAVRRHHQPPRE